MKKVTYAEFMTFNPCWDTDRVKAIYDQYPNGMTALDILHREDVSADDKQWSVLREDFIPAPILHEFACVCAEYALSLIDNPDPRSVNAIAVKRRWINGKATDEELAVARAAARDAASYAAWAAACDAARDAALYVAWAAARDAARAAAKNAQCAVLEMMLTEDTP